MQQWMLRKGKKMKKEDVAEQVLTINSDNRSSHLMLEKEIPGALVYHHVMLEGDHIRMTADGTFVRILFLCDGKAEFRVDEKVSSYSEKAFLAVRHDQSVEVAAVTKADVLEICWAVNEKDIEEINEKREDFPITGAYKDAEQYRDPFKSEKTISRAILPQRTIPRFAMGSVETYGEDLIGQHAHPLLDQFFFSFPENDMDLLIDEITYPMKGNSLLHIPLGSNHGVRVKGGQVAHYIWIDFIQDPEAANRYLDEVHKPTGTMRSFEK